MDNIEKTEQVCNTNEAEDPSILAFVGTLQASSLSESAIQNLLPLVKVSLTYFLDSPTLTSPFSAKMSQYFTLLTPALSPPPPVTGTSSSTPPSPFTPSSAI